MELDIRVTKKKDYVYTVELKGALDTETYRQLEDELKEIIDEKTRAVIFDMKGLEYISSIGVKVIFETRKTLQSRNATFAMTELKPQIKKVFDVLKILPIFDIFEDMPEADKYIDQIIREETGKQGA